jgi:C-terminal processing protease CtpA/Prc
MPPGVIVSDVKPNSPAAKCGLQANDVIIGLDDFEVRGPRDLSVVVSSSPAGRKLRLKALRETQPLQVEVELGEKNCDQPQLITLDEQFSGSAEELLRKLQERQVELEISYNSFKSIPGEWKEREETLVEIRMEMEKLARERQLVETQLRGTADNSSSAECRFPARFSAFELKPQGSKYFGVEGTSLLVTKIDEQSTADKAGLRVGDVIVGTNSRPRMTSMELRLLLLRQRGNVILNVVRKSGTERKFALVRLAWNG